MLRGESRDGVVAFEIAEKKADLGEGQEGDVRDLPEHLKDTKVGGQIVTRRVKFGVSKTVGLREGYENGNDILEIGKKALSHAILTTKPVPPRKDSSRGEMESNCALAKVPGSTLKQLFSPTTAITKTLLDKSPFVTSKKISRSSRSIHWRRSEKWEMMPLLTNVRRVLKWQLIKRLRTHDMGHRIRNASTSGSDCPQHESCAARRICVGPSDLQSYLMPK
uniref:Uncharacterized protein n=1 Tax=Steinernema glaseri TaxID=37863 RepID=A0A1I7YEE8_9BILA